MPSHPLAQQAREHHRKAQQHEANAARHREQRDALVRRLRAEDPGTWTYARLASTVGCSPELVAVIIRAGRHPDPE